MSISMCAEIV